MAKEWRETAFEKYRLLDFDEAMALGHTDESERRYLELSSFLVDTESNRLLGVDGGEPEDQRFTRDWAWVKTEMVRAYREGYMQGQRDLASLLESGRS